MSYLKATLQNMNDDDISNIYKVKKIIKIDTEIKRQNHKNKPIYKKRSNHKNKPIYKKRPNHSSKELVKARQIFLKECLPNKELIDELLLTISYTKNWTGKLIPIDVSNNEIIVNSLKNLNNKLKFNKTKFFQDKDFKTILISEYNKIFLNVHLSFFPSSKDENIFYIKISKKY